MLKLLKLKKVIIPLVSLIFVLGILIYFSDRLALVIVPKFSYSKTKTPGAYLIPILRELKPSKEKFKANSILTYKDIRLKTPWELREKSDFDLSTLFAFVNKKGISIEQQSTDEGILQSLLKEKPIEVQKYNLLFGEENLKSEYAIVNLILNTTPDQASIFKPLSELARIHPLLIWKNLYSHLGDVIYQFKSNNLNGFQFGNPQSTEHVRVHVFNNKDQIYRLHFLRATQVEIDYILSTIVFL